MTLREQVARVLYDADHADDPVPRLEQGWDDPHWMHVFGNDYMHAATAAIRVVLAALREPTPEMWQAAEAAIDPYSSASEASLYWQAMLATAIRQLATPTDEDAVRPD